MFDNENDEEDDPFTIKPKATALSKPIKKIESNPKIQPLSIAKPKVNIHQDESDEDDGLFGMKKAQPKKIPTVSTPTVIEKPKSPSSDEDLFPTSKVAKPQLPSTTTKTSDDEEPLFVTKLPVQQPVVSSPTPTVVPQIKKPVSTADTDSENELFGISDKKPKTPVTEVSKSTASVKSNEDEESLGTSTNKYKIPTKETQKMTSPTKPDDDDDELFLPKSTVSLPPPVILPPLPSAPSVTTAAYEDPLLGIRKPAETTPKLPPVIEQRKTSTSDSDEDSASPRLGQNKAAVKPGEKPNVGQLIVR
jgi:hypothetical protein